MRGRQPTNRKFPAVLTALACLLMVLRCPAQTFSNIHSFTAKSDTSSPWGGLTLSGGTLYGGTEGVNYDSNGEADSGATLFAISTDGSDMRGFVPSDADFFPGGLLVTSNMIYGTSERGGALNWGTVFGMPISGTATTFVHGFDQNEGASPNSSLILLGNTLYGTLNSGNPSIGTVFSINTDGTGYTNIYTFWNDINGGFPSGGLVASGNTLYGTTYGGGTNGFGEVFAINTDGTGFSNIYSFGGTNDGIDPQCALVLSKNTLYGTATGGGTWSNGTVFRLNTDGSCFTNLHSFGPSGPRNLFQWYFTNSDGANPAFGVTLSGNTLYGTTPNGGPGTGGTIFAVNIDGTGFTNLYFGSRSSGAFAFEGPLTLSWNVLYGSSEYGGAFGYGNVFSLTFTPTLAITASGTNVILTWPTNVAGFDYTSYQLQCTSNLLSPSWTSVSPPPVIANGLETVTNTIASAQMFYRLSQ